jgi:hypothetical protein
MRSGTDAERLEFPGTAVAEMGAAGGSAMFMFDRRQLFVGAALIVLIEIVTAAMRAAGH